MDTDDVKETLLRKRSKQVIPAKNFLSTGSTLLDLACTGRTAGGLVKGHYYLLVGDSSSGKTFLSLTCLAEAAKNPNFEDYRFLFFSVEEGAIMDIGRFFGQEVADRIEIEHPYLVEDFYDGIDKAYKEGRPFIAIVDSMDALSSEQDEKTLEKQKATRRKRAAGKQVEEAGSYGDGKAKINSRFLRRVVSRLKSTGSILIIISQTRDNIGFGAQFNPKTRSGGKALKFYATLELWSSVKEEIKKNVRGKKRQLGIISKVLVKKNRVTGRNRGVEIPIYHSVGIDDIGSCVDFLVDEEHWKETQGKIKAPEFDFVGPREKLIHHIEEEDGEKEIRTLVAAVWKELEEACAVKRKPRYE